MTQPATSPTPEVMPVGAGVRALKIAVVVMGIMIVLGVLTVIGRIVYLSSQGPRQASVPAGAARVAGAARLALPPGAQVRQISLSGDRIAVHFEGPAGAGIAVVDLASGAVLTRIDVVPEVPR